MARDYNTRQKALVLQALMDMGERAVTVEELMEGLRRKDSRVGRATVYRQLDRLVEAGKARTLPGAEGTLYQYVDDASACAHHLHFRCQRCGRLYHVECGCLQALSGHLRQEHQFALDPGSTVLQGICGDCGKEKEYGAVDP